MNMIELWGITVSVQKHFWAPPVKILNELSLKIEPGSCFGLLGPNGAGKTTTLRVALGLAKPQSGTAKLFDKNPVTAMHDAVSALCLSSRISLASRPHASWSRTMLASSA